MLESTLLNLDVWPLFRRRWIDFLNLENFFEHSLKKVIAGGSETRRQRWAHFQKIDLDQRSRSLKNKLLI